MKRTTSSLEGGCSLDAVEGVLRRESKGLLFLAKLPMIFPSERLRFALQTEISCSISPSLRRLRYVIANFYFD